MAGDTRERMIEAAVHALRRDGVEGMSFTGVLRESGAARGAIYHHFPGGKSQLVAEAATDNGNEVRALLAQLPAESPAAVVRGYHVSDHVGAMVVPGSGQVKKQAEAEGLDKVFKSAGFDWREAGCSMCLAMNPDKLAPGERCASTSNRNFEGRQGRGGRTHLVSPEVAAATAVAGRFATPSDLDS